MNNFINNLKGDKGIWALVFLLALISFMPVYSASTNLVYVIGKGSTLGYLVKHLGHLFLGFCIIYFVHKMPYHYTKALSMLLMPLVIVLLIYTMFQGTTIGGANASRWISIPFVGLSFQTSSLAFIVLMVYVAKYLAKIKEKEFTFKSSLIELWMPVFLVLILILPANFSTTALIFVMVCMLVFVGQYPIKYLAAIIGAGIVMLTLFILMAKAFPDAMPNRVKTWENRIERFSTNKTDEDNYQIDKAKIAIASGRIYGLGPGKSVQKNFLPQSSSDFIYAIIVEEYGLIGGLGILFVYMLLFFRFIVCAHKASSFYGKLLIIGLGFPIIFQALINMGVAVELLPVTGQTLPLISSGGTSIWMTCAAIGVILSVSKKDEEVAADLLESEKRNDALQRIIDKEIQLEVEREDEQKESKEESSKNPLEPVLNQ
ncbi:FtsW/RodA/SpoVE family cell cycle protein [uncultured Flavobacterium sp.]|uniref:FtsW/RodA/SpoVE family cell cycle protein n=1 Tax=uncultured Flavobacterium sp. TaxID=165435 RepID=UPI0030EF7BDD|tara:strand:- start:128572 stop:129861 length:1290 start_codon:yes stop_codon:yes gene_type:complete